MAEEENVKVAVRVRPFNERELNRRAINCVQMNGKTTIVTDPHSKKQKSYTYDYSYWSFDGGKQLSNGYYEPDSSHSNGKRYCDQKMVYNDLGKGILKNAWEGYNATLFAYGQTGSGKSYSVIGYKENKGIVPLICEELFQGISSNKEEKQFEVKFSMLEIYQEVVRDLLNISGSKAGLKIRQHPRKGFYADGLKEPMVTNQADIQAKMDEGTVNRTIKATNMNATSSRAHTIVTITFIQKFVNNRGQETAKSSIINLVDLAGSERVESTGATGDRLKEGASINLSLTCLGDCINALVKQGQGGNVQVPYRNSSLTKLLMNALGGNSKTIMVAAVSPADINYEETVSTLHYADRAKQIKTKAVVNEDPTEKLIRELREENDKLKKMMQTGKIDRDIIDVDADGIDDRDMENIRKKLEEEMKARLITNEQEMANMKKSYEEKLKLATKERANPSIIQKKEEEKTNNPHIYNLNADPQLSGKMINIFTPGHTSIGNRKGQESDITMIGPGMQEQHAVIYVDKNYSVDLTPMNSECRVLVNGNTVYKNIKLQHNDRIMFGTTQFWVFQTPFDKSAAKQKYPTITYEFAREEIAAKSGIDMNVLSSDIDTAALQQELLEVMPSVEVANGISEELDRKVKFEIILASPQMSGNPAGKTEIQVKLKNLQNGTEYVWPKEKFMNRLYQMKEMYEKYEDEDEWELPDEEDPFQESLDTEIHIGTVQVILQPIAHMVELKEQLEITSLKGAEIGLMNVEVVPCNKNGKEYSENDDVFVDDPEELIGSEIHFKFKILSCRGLPNKYTDIYCSYTYYLFKEEIKTKVVQDTTNPNFNHVRQFKIKPVTKQFIDYLMNGSVVIKVMGKQKLRKSAIPRETGLSTRELLKNDRTLFSKTATLMNGFQLNGRVVDPQRQSIIVELLLMKKTQARLQLRVDNVVKLIKEAENISKMRVSTTMLREVMNAATPEQADAIIRKRLAGESDNKMDRYSRPPQSAACSVV